MIFERIRLIYWERQHIGAQKSQESRVFISASREPWAVDVWDHEEQTPDMRSFHTPHGDHVGVHQHAAKQKDKLQRMATTPQKYMNSYFKTFFWARCMLCILTSYGFHAIIRPNAPIWRLECRTDCRDPYGAS